MKRMIFALLYGASLATAACGAKPLEQVPSHNAEVTAEVIAIVDDIKIYRLDVGDRTIYFADARGTTSWEQRHVYMIGKTPVTRVERFSVDTVK